MSLVEFLLSSVSGNLLLQAAGSILGDLTVDQIARLWNQFQFGHEELEQALHSSFRKTLSSLEIMFFSPTSFSDQVQIFFRNPNEQSLAKSFSEKILAPFLKNQAPVLAGKRKEFCSSSRALCRYFKSRTPHILDWKGLIMGFPEIEAKTIHPLNNILSNQKAHATFHLITAVLFSGNSLAKAPALKEEMTSANSLLIARMKNAGKSEAEKMFSTFPQFQNLFFELMAERDLLLSGLSFFLNLEITENPRVSAAMEEFRYQEEQLSKEKKKSEKQEKDRTLLKSVEDLRAEIQEIEARILSRQVRNLPVKTLETDLEDLKNTLLPMQAQVNSLVFLSNQVESWRGFIQNLSDQQNLFREAFQTIHQKLDDLALTLSRQDMKLDRVENGVTEVRLELRELRQDTGEMKSALGELLNIKSWDRLEKKYKVLGTIGHGQFGIVLKVVNLSTNEIRALKVLRSDASLDSEVKKRFMTEACTSYELSHPNLVKVSDVDPIGSFFEMDFLEGKTLRKALRELPRGMSREVFFNITNQLIWGLEYLHHERHLAHRDLKPENIMLVPTEHGKVVLTDLGAITYLDVVQETLGKGLAGTALYMAPEQFEGEKSPQVDIYALGIMMYEMVCGTTPFTGGNFLEIKKRHSVEPPPPLRSRNPDADPHIESVIRKCLEKSPGDRFKRVGEIREALKGGKPENVQGRDSPNPEVTGKIIPVLKCEATKVNLQTSRKLGETWRFGDGRITQGIISPDQKSLFLATTTGVYIYDIDGLYKEKILLPDQWINTIFLSRDGKALFTGGKDRSVRACSLPDGREISLCRGHSAEISALDLSPDGKILASAGWDGQILLWRVIDGKEVRKIQAHSMTVNDVKFSTCGNFLVTACWDGSVKIFCANSGTELQILKGHQGPVQAVQFLPPHDMVISGAGDKTLRLWDIGTGEEKMRFAGHTAGITAIRTTLQGEFILSGSFDKTIRVWKPCQETEVTRLSGHFHSVQWLSLSTNGKILASGSADSSVILWDTQLEKKIRELAGHGSPVRTIAISRDPALMASGEWDGTIKFWDLKTGEFLRKCTGHTSHVNALLLSRDGIKLVSGSADRTIRLWDANSCQELKKLSGHSDWVNTLAWSPDERLLASGGNDESVKIWDLSDGRQLFHLTGHQNRVNAVIFTPDGRNLLSGGRDGTIRIWDAETGEELRKFSDVAGDITSLSLSPDGKFVVIGTREGNILIRGFATGKELKRLSGHTGSVSSVHAFFAEEKIIISGGMDKTIRIWDFNRAKELKRLEGHTDLVSVIKITADGCRIISGSLDGTIRCWEMI